MTSAQDYRDQLATLKTNVSNGVEEFVRGGFVSRTQADAFLSAVGLELPETPEQRQAREELESFRATVRTAIDAANLPYAHREQALARFGL